jgi:hypothetical protein
VLVQCHAGLSLVFLQHIILKESFVRFSVGFRHFSKSVSLSVHPLSLVNIAVLESLFALSVKFPVFKSSLVLPELAGRVVVMDALSVGAAIFKIPAKIFSVFILENAVPSSGNDVTKLFTSVFY